MLLHTALSFSLPLLSPLSYLEKHYSIHTSAVVHIGVGKESPLLPVPGMGGGGGGGGGRPERDRRQSDEISHIILQYDIVEEVLILAFLPTGLNCSACGGAELA